MQIHRVRCPRCDTEFIVSKPLWEIGTVRLRCTSCTHAFLPADSPGNRSIESAANANVPIRIWEPEESP